MALQDIWSGTFNTSNQYVKYATEMIENSTNVSANTSNVTINVWAWRTNSYGPTYGSGTLYCTINGTQYSQAISPSQQIGTSKICLFSKTLDIGHNADGTYNLATYAQISLDTPLSSDNNGWGFNLTTIPRASDFTISGNTLGSPITININRASSGFTHNIFYDLPDGSRRAEWDGVATQQIFTPALADAQYITNSDNGTAKITVDTYNGSTYIGTVRHTFTMYVPASVVPTASGLSVAIAGTGRDKTLAMYIQTISKVTASFSSAGIYGSTIVSNTISIKRQSDDADSQVISGTSGTTANPVALSGTYIVTATATDSRGRTATLTATITVQAYSPPTVNTFSTARSTSPTTSVLATINVAWSMAANNPTNVTVVGVDKSNVSTTLYTLTGSTAGSINTTQTYTGQVDTSAYTYTITITDSFGNVAKATATVGVSFVEFCLSKGFGIGVGKIWERGALDVGGDVFVTGEVNATGGVGPAGVISMFAGSVAPGGYLLCQGQAVSRTTYADLFAAIGTTYGAGDGSTTFNIPEMRNRVPVGFNTGQPEFNTLGKGGGEINHTLSTNEIPAHKHSSVEFAGYSVFGGNPGNPAQGTGYGTQLNTLNTGSAGGGAAHNNLQPYLTLNFIIKI